MAVEMNESWADDPGNFTLTNNNLTVTLDVAPWRSIIATKGFSAGKWYWEVTVDTLANPGNYSASVGICLTTHTKTSFMGSLNGFGLASQQGSNQVDFLRQGTTNNPLGPDGTEFVATDVLMFALNMDTNHLYGGINGAWLIQGDPVADFSPIYDNIPAGIWYPSCSLIVATSAVTFNFGKTPFAYSLPAGFLAADQGGPFALDEHTLGPGSAAEVADEIESTLEGIDDSKVIHKIQLIKSVRDSDEIKAILIVDT